MFQQVQQRSSLGKYLLAYGLNRYSVPGQNMANSISADQVVAEQLGQETRFSSIQLDSTDGALRGMGRAFPLLGTSVANQSPDTMIR